jgi:cytochrome P450
MTTAHNSTLPGLRTIKFAGKQSGLLRFLIDPISSLLAIHESFGMIGAMRRGDPSFVCAFSPITNQQILTDIKTFGNFATFPYKLPTDSSFYRNIRGLPLLNDEEHKRYRRLLMPAVSKERLESYQPKIVSITKTFFRDWLPDTSIDILGEMKHLSLLIARACLFGLEADEEALEFGQLVSEFQRLTTSVSTLLLPVALPGTSFKRMGNLSDAIEQRFLALIEQKRALPQQQHDMLSVLIHQQESDEQPLTNAELQGHFITLFVAGHDTVTQTLISTLFLLAQHPTVYAAVVDELDTVLAGAPPTPAQLAMLPILDSIIKESMRLIPAVPYLFFRQNRSAVTLGNYDIPMGSLLVISPLITHRISELYPEPNKFKPERWQTIKPTAFEYLPFGGGSRLCLGIGFANQTLRIVLAMLLQRFRLTVEPQTRIDVGVESIVLGQRKRWNMRISTQDRQFVQPSPISGNIHRLVDLTQTTNTK